MLEKAVRLIKYLNSIKLEIPNIDKPLLVPDESTGVNVLRSPATSGNTQVVISLPSAKMEGNIDNMRGNLTTIIYVVNKWEQASNKSFCNVEKYIDHISIINTIYQKIASDISENNIDGGCALLNGFQIQEVLLLPEFNVFNGWNGWSMTITFE